LSTKKWHTPWYSLRYIPKLASGALINKGFLQWQKDNRTAKTALTEALTEKDKGMHLL
jgi:hypothetical protein